MTVHPTQVIVADVTDRGEHLLAPLTDLRPVFDVRTGALTTLERLTLRSLLAGSAGPTGLLVPEPMAELARERHVLPVNPELRGDVVLINGACPLADVSALPLNSAEVDAASGVLVRAHVQAARVGAVLGGNLDGLRVKAADGAAALLRPWHVRTQRDACLEVDLDLLMRQGSESLSPAGVTILGDAGRVRIDPTARVLPTVVIDAQSGPVVIGARALVRPGTIIVGPAYIGHDSTVLERTLIKAGTAIGPWCKVAGEIGGTIFQGYTNKAHDGHLGDSWVGEWANLGAGTTNSNLLNTYGEVVCRPLGRDGKPGSNERSGQQFLGAIIGDHVKTAIGTRIMTGAVVGTGTMFAASGALSGTLPAMGWVTDAGVRTFRSDKFLEIAVAAMGRRKVTMGGAYRERLEAMSG